MIDVLVTEKIVGSAVDELARQFRVQVQPDLWQDPPGLLAAAAEARALLVRNQTQVTAEVIGAAERLEIVARAGAGLDNIDVQAASRAGVVVSYAPGENAVSVAELTIGLMLAVMRRIAAADRHVKAGGWDRLRFTGWELAGKTLGVVGLGRIGRLVARRAAAFQMRLLAYDPLLAAGDPNAVSLGVTLTNLEQLLAEADVVTCHVPLMDSTRRLFSHQQFAQMKPTAIFVNTSRGEVVDEAALAAALESGRLGGAALDVRAVEPPAASPLNSMDNVILTPHIAAFTHEAQERVVSAVCGDVAAVLSGNQATQFANFPKPKR